MSADPAPDASADFRNVVDQTVEQAQNDLSSFTDITWMSDSGRTIDDPASNWVVNKQEPSDYIGKAEPTNLAITLTINPPSMKTSM